MPDEIIQAPASATASPEGSPNKDNAGSKSTTESLHDLRDKVGNDLSMVTEAARDTAHTAMQKVEANIAEQTGFAAHQVGGIAMALKKVGSELETGDHAAVGRYATQIGASVQSIAKDMEGRDLREIAAMAENFGRKQPLAFLGVAALAGLAASRFLTASAKRIASGSTNAQPGNFDGGEREDG